MNKPNMYRTILPALALTLTLAACGGSPAAQAPAATSAPVPTTVPAGASATTPTAAVTATSASTPSVAATSPTLAVSTTPAATAASAATNAPATVAPVATSAAQVPSPMPTNTNAAGEPAVPNADGQRMIGMARADLAKRLSVNESTITTALFEAREWSDGGLGCPKPGVMYLQVITPGYFIVLEHDSKRYNYHTDLRNQAVLCEQ